MNTQLSAVFIVLLAIGIVGGVFLARSAQIEPAQVSVRQAQP